MMKTALTLAALFFGSSILAQAIKIYESMPPELGPCEPSIAINPQNPQQMVAGSVLNFVHNSHDGGKSWTTKKLTSTYGVWGDPCIIADNMGSFYYFHLSDPTGLNWASDEILDRIVCQKSSDGGKKWSPGTYMGHNPPKQQDKEWAAANLQTNQLACTWTQFDKYKSKDKNDKSNILFSASQDGGTTWSEAMAINQIPGNCLDNKGTTEGAVPAFGPENEIYVAWGLNEKIYFDRSTDGGKNWLAEDAIVAKQPGGWKMKIPGWNRCNGMPITACDVSNSAQKGTVYVCWGDIKNGKKNSDIWLAKSNDKGDSWSKPIRVNQDKTRRHQFLPWMAVDPITGHIYIVYYDRRNHKNNLTDVYLAVSRDGGATFAEQKINTDSFEPSDNYFMGDYNNIAAYNGTVRPIWTELRNGKLSVWTALLQF